MEVFEMRKYKLIKEFPLSPKLGNIVDFNTQEPIGDNIRISNFGDIENLLLDDCKNWPEFWAEYVFTTRDRVYIFRGDNYWVIQHGQATELTAGAPHYAADYTGFSTEENALKWIERYNSLVMVEDAYDIF